MSTTYYLSSAFRNNVVSVIIKNIILHNIKISVFFHNASFHYDDALCQSL